MVKNKTFIFKYEPSLATPHQMFTNMWRAVDTGKPNIQPKNVVKSNSLEAIYRCITPSRWGIFACLVEKKPSSLTELSQLLNKDYANVWKDVRALEGLGMVKLIKLKKGGNGAKRNQWSKEVRPVAMYDRIVFDLPIYQRFQVQIESIDLSRVFRKTNKSVIIYNF